mmetsp:Transcript_63542/g.119305  ORF Transcript_63542/g.119305 Transcript_63542/m.119305 type:complete len:246 (+) Transcript_63542:636-1373(+)
MVHSAVVVVVAGFVRFRRLLHRLGPPRRAPLLGTHCGPRPSPRADRAQARGGLPAAAQLLGRGVPGGHHLRAGQHGAHVRGLRARVVLQRRPEAVRELQRVRQLLPVFFGARRGRGGGRGAVVHPHRRLALAQVPAQAFRGPHQDPRSVHRRPHVHGLRGRETTVVHVSDRHVRGLQPERALSGALQHALPLLELRAVRLSEPRLLGRGLLLWRLPGFLFSHVPQHFLLDGVAAALQRGVGALRV